MKVNHRWSGFTLIESILVLAVVSAMVFLPTLAIREWQENREIVRFFSQFEKLYFETQQSAFLSHQARGLRVFSHKEANKMSFEIYEGRVTVSTVELFAPKGIEVAHNNKMTFKIRSGYPKEQLSFFIFQDNKHKKRITFQAMMGGSRLVRKEENL